MNMEELNGLTGGFLSAGLASFLSVWVVFVEFIADFIRVCL